MGEQKGNSDLWKGNDIGGVARKTEMKIHES
jgi:hypothetical protein